VNPVFCKDFLSHSTLKWGATQIFDWDEKALTIYYYDQDLLDWFPIETTIDTKNNTLTAYSDHLTVFDYKANNWQSQMLPTVDAFKTSDFTGSGTYQINMWTPPALGGLQPPLTLSYNSQIIDESSAFSQASWVGMGWDLDTGSITRNMHGTDSDNGSVDDDTFSISAGGVSGVLLPIAKVGDITTYNTADQSFMKVESNDFTYSFTAWTKDGTKYEFNKIDVASMNLSNGCSTSSSGTTWRWSLSSVTDVHGNTLNYTYFIENKPGCLNQIAVYPATITYGNGKYRVNFVREARSDYQVSWGGPASRTLYGTQRLHEVQIQHNSAGVWTNVKRYVFTYAPNDTTNIYPNFDWSAGGKTLTLIGVQEFGSDGSALPSVTFTYGDSMHLTKVNNGQGGTVDVVYSAWQYFDDINKDIRSLNTAFGTDECVSAQGIGTLWVRVGSVGTVKCEPVPNYLQVGNNAHDHTVAERPLPEHLVKPGSTYRYLIKGMTFDGTSTAPVYGFRDTGTGQLVVVTSAVAFNNPDPHESDQRSLVMPTTYNQSNTKLRLECQNCFFSQIEFVLFPLMYRVTSRTVTIQPTGIASTYTYSYDNASPNSSDNSAAANISGATLYTPVLREFRGHAMSQVVNPEGLATVNWFHQSDSLKGRAYDTLVMKRDFYDPLESTNANWVGSGGTHIATSVNQKDFDNAIESVNSAADWNVSFARTTASLTSDEMAVAHVRLSGPNAQGKVGLTNGTQSIEIYLSSIKASVNDLPPGHGSKNLLLGLITDEWYGKNPVIKMTLQPRQQLITGIFL